MGQDDGRRRALEQCHGAAAPEVQLPRVEPVFLVGGDHGLAVELAQQHVEAGFFGQPLHQVAAVVQQRVALAHLQVQRNDARSESVAARQAHQKSGFRQFLDVPVGAGWRVVEQTADLVDFDRGPFAGDQGQDIEHAAEAVHARIIHGLCQRYLSISDKYTLIPNASRS
jgi:hypothetical protein